MEVGAVGTGISGISIAAESGAFACSKYRRTSSEIAAGAGAGGLDLSHAARAAGDTRPGGSGAGKWLRAKSCFAA